jgi:predicted DNA-binding protein (UPF0251 family)
MIKLTTYNPEKTYMFPSGKIATPEAVLRQFPAITVFPHIIETDESEQILWAVENLAAMRSVHGLDEGLSDEEAIAELEAIRNAPPPEPGVSAEERIAAALEFQNIATLLAMMGEE